MKLNRKLVLILSLVLSLALATGGTLAYLSDTDADVNVMTLGSVYIVQNEQERDADGNLVEFTNNKPMLPAVGTIAWDDEKLTIGEGEYKVFADELANVVDKIVTVTNTGKSDAYVRTIIAFEAPEGFDDALLHINYNGTDVVMDENWAYVEIDGARYVVTSFTYREVLAAGETSAPSLIQVFLDSKATNEDIEVLGDTYEILVLSQAVQTAGFDNAAAALNTAFGEANGENYAVWFKGLYVDGVVNEDMVGSPGDKNADNNPPVMAEVWVSSDTELAEALADGYTTIGLKAGTYDINSAKNVTGITLVGEEGTVISIKNEGEGGCDYGFQGSDITFSNITFDTTSNNGSYRGFGYMTATFNGCEFVGPYTTYCSQTFNNCTFDTNNGYIWTWSAEAVTFNGCTFNANGNSKCILAHGGASTVISIKDCTFAATEKGYTGSGDNTAVVEIDPAYSNTYTITFTGNNTKTDSYAGWTRVKDGSTGHTITGVD